MERGGGGAGLIIIIITAVISVHKKSREPETWLKACGLLLGVVGVGVRGWGGQ